MFTTTGHHYYVDSRTAFITSQHECCICGEFEECAYLENGCQKDEAGWSFRRGRFYCKDCADERF